jgi:predicted dehydrogenase
MINSRSRLKFKSPMPRRLKWGVAGCGQFAEEYFLPALQLAQRSKLISVFSHEIKRAKNIASKFSAPNAFDDYDAFLSSDIDTVYISSKNSDHHYQIIKAANAGKNIVCEKPIAINSTQAEEIIEVCKKNNVVLLINYLHRFHPLVQKAKELIDKNMIGKIISISASYNIDLSPNDNFRFNKELSGGGVLRDLGSQIIDMLRYFGGEITDVKAFMDNVIYKSDVEDFACAIVKFEKGGYGYFSVSYNAKKANNKIEVIGRNGSLSIENYLTKRNQATKLIIDLHDEAKKVFRKRTNKMSYLIRSSQRTFLKHEPPAVTAEDGLASMILIEKIENHCLHH